MRDASVLLGFEFLAGDEEDMIRSLVSVDPPALLINLVSGQSQHQQTQLRNRKLPCED